MPRSDKARLNITKLTRGQRRAKEVGHVRHDTKQFECDFGRPLPVEYEAFSFDVFEATPWTSARRVARKLPITGNTPSSALAWPFRGRNPEETPCENESFRRATGSRSTRRHASETRRSVQGHRLAISIARRRKRQTQHRSSSMRANLSARPRYRSLSQTPSSTLRTFRH